MSSTNPLNAGVEVKSIASAASNTRKCDPIKVEWQDLSYFVEVKHGEQTDLKTILHPLSGSAKPGEVLAIMGTSGAGKSTLLDILAGRLVSDNVSGNMLANGKPIDWNTFRRLSGYVMQSDALFPHLTVRETIRFAAYLRCHNKTEEECNAIAEDTIKLLRLESCADTIIGNDVVRGISGGQKRRVTIAVDIVHQPSIIFLDEPSSGLDSLTTLSLCEALRSIARDGNRTIVMTIHQPSTKVFTLFDKVLFLAEGKTTFSGNSRALMPYMKNFVRKHGISVHSGSEEEEAEVLTGNPPELFLELCDTLAAEDRLQLLFDETVQSLGITASEAGGGGERMSIFGGESSRKMKSLEATSYAHTIVDEVKILTKRAFTNFMRTPEIFQARIGASIIFGILEGTLFYNTHNDSLGVSKRASYFIFSVANFNYTSLDALQIILSEREIFMREYSRGAYRAVSYVIAGTVVVFPFMLVLAFLFTMISWWLVNLPANAGLYLFDLLATWIIIVTGFCFAQFVSVIVPDPMAGQVAGSGILSVMFLTSGFFISKDNIPPWWIWLYYISLFHWGFNPLLINGLSETSYDGMSTEDILSSYGMEGESKWLGLGVLMLFVLLFRYLFYRNLITKFSGQRSE